MTPDDPLALMPCVVPDCGRQECWGCSSMPLCHGHALRVPPSLSEAYSRARAVERAARATVVHVETLLVAQAQG